MLSAKNTIHALDLAIGLKEMLLDRGFFTISDLLSISPGELALILGVDLYIARLIIAAAQRQEKAADIELMNQEWSP